MCRNENLTKCQDLVVTYPDILLYHYRGTSRTDSPGGRSGYSICLRFALSLQCFILYESLCSRRRPRPTLFIICCIIIVNIKYYYTICDMP